MSAPSGIKVPPALTSAFASAQSNSEDVRALVFIIEGETFKVHDTIKPKSTYKDDIALLPASLPSHKTPASFAYRLDSKEGGKYEWMMVTFVPDDAGVRAKMLQASSRAGLLKALGGSIFKHDWFATNINDLTPSALTAHLNHLSSPPPLSASEAALAEVRAAEEAEAKRAALDPENEARRRKAVIGLGGKMAWGDGIMEAMEKVAKRSDEGWVVVLEISATNTGALSLLKSEACTPSQLASKLPPKSPAYTFYSFPTPPPAYTAPAIKAPTSSPRNTFQASQGGVRVVNASTAPLVDAGESAEGEKKDEQTEEPKVEELSVKEETASPEEETTPAPAQAPEGKGRVLFIYTCPSGSPIKFRMVYSSSVRSVQQDASDKAGVEVSAKLETSDISDLTESHLKSSLSPSKPTHSSSLPTPTSTSSSLAPGAGFAAFGRPRPSPSLQPVRSATQIPLPASTGPSTPITEGGGSAGDADSQANIRKAFDAFGPRVGAGGGGGFARPRPAGRRPAA